MVGYHDNTIQYNLEPFHVEKQPRQCGEGKWSCGGESVQSSLVELNRHEIDSVDTHCEVTKKAH